MFSEKPGLCKVEKCSIDVLDGSEVVNKPPHQVPIHLRDAVNQEIGNLLEGGIITESNSD